MMRIFRKIQNSQVNVSALSSFYFSRQFKPNRAVPSPANRNILITAALPYVNNTPHLGNLIGAILSADAYARYCRMRGYNTLYVCGTDQYGTTTQVKALKQKTTALQICNKYYKLHKDIYDWFQIEFDHFGRTSKPIHTSVTHQIFKLIHQNNGTQIKTMNQFYCKNCKISLADRYVVGTCKKCGAFAKGDQCDECSTIFKDPIIELKDPCCSVCKQTPMKIETKHLYLKLKDCSEKLKKWLIDNDGLKTWSKNAKSVTKGWLNDGLQNRCISRNLNWGVPVPQTYLEGKKVFYVWFQAPIGYISITADILGDKWRDWWQAGSEFNVQLNQFMGKDNIAFHSIIFPATLDFTNKPFIKPRKLSVTEYLLYEGGKFSKSNNIGVFGDDCKDTGIKSDVWRYYLLINRPETYDSHFLWSELAAVNKSDLMNTIGNMCQRVFKYAYTKLGNQIPEIDTSAYETVELKFIDQFSRLLKCYCDNLEEVNIKQGANIILQIGQLLNKYIQDTQFWNKGNIAKNRHKLIIGVLLRSIQFYAVIMRPYLPWASYRILELLSLTQENTVNFTPRLQPHLHYKQYLLNPEQVRKQNEKWKQIKLQKPEILFQEISEERVIELEKKYGKFRKQL